MFAENFQGLENFPRIAGIPYGRQFAREERDLLQEACEVFINVNQEGGGLMPRTVFHHDVTTSYPPEELKDLPGVPVYAARVFASTHPGDVVILPPETGEHYRYVVEHYAHIGLPVADTVDFGRHDLVRKYPDHDLSVFYFGAKEHAVRPNRRWQDAAARLNSKNYFMHLCQELGVPVPVTVCVDSLKMSEIDLVGFQRVFPVYVKVAVSASGFGVWRCENADEFRAVVEGLTVPFQIQEALPEGTVFLNVQYEVGQDGAPLRGAITFQVLRGNTHSGNRFPTPYRAADIYTVTDPLAQWAADEGMQGVLAFDVAATQDGRFVPIECNPRWNGASYFSRVADKLNVPEWESLNVTFRPRSFTGFHLPTGLAYSRTHREGIAIVNWGCVGDGKLGIFVAGNPESRRELISEFTTRFG